MLNNHKASHEKRKGRGVGGMEEGRKKKKRSEGKKEGSEESDLLNCYQLLSPLNRFIFIKADLPLMKQ